LQLRSKTARALLLYPPTGVFVREDRCQTPIDAMTAQANKAPLDLGYMAAVLEASGVEVRVRDYAAERSNLAAMEADLRAFQPQMVVASVTTPTWPHDVAAFHLVKRVLPETLTVARGGPFARWQSALEHDLGPIDVAICGEPEAIIAELADGRPLDTIAGIAFHDGERVVRTAERAFLSEDAFEALPFPARHLLRNELYLAPDTGEPVTVIDTARGCPHSCTYCLVAASAGRAIRQRSPRRVVDELEDCLVHHGIRTFFFKADTFTWEEDWVVALCQQIVSRQLDVRWAANSRVDTVSPRRLEWMKRAGCFVLAFGIESGSQESLDRMKKRATLDDARQAVRLCREAGIRSYGLFLIGMPWEDLAHVEQTIAFMRELDCDYADVNIAYPLPGTEYHAQALALGLFEPTRLCEGDYAHAVVGTRSLTAADLRALRRRALREFYLRPRYILRTLGRVDSPRVFANHLSHGLRLARQLIAG